MTMLERLNAHERQLIQRLRGHPLFQRLPALGWEELLAVLIQQIQNILDYTADFAARLFKVRQLFGNC